MCCYVSCSMCMAYDAQMWNQRIYVRERLFLAHS
nr:hypothetical protein Q903MT_gene537 [Picea sitchensis]